MAQQVSCPRCGATLAVQDATPTAGLSCPRCLAPLGSPSTGIRETAPTATGVSESAAAPAYPVRPAVGLPDVSWMAAPGLDLDVHHDGKRGFSVLTVLIVLNTMGIVLTFAANKGKPHSAATEGQDIAAMLLLALLFGILDLLVIIKIGIWLHQRSAPSSLREGGSAFLKGVAMTFAFLGLAMAVIVFFFFACAGVLMPYGL